MTRTRSLVLFGSLCVALGSAGCDSLGDSNSGVSPEPPVTSPPPKDPMPATDPVTVPTGTDDPGPPRCNSSADCTGGGRCAIDEEHCASGCSSWPGGPAIWRGLCVADDQPPTDPVIPRCVQSTQCAVGLHCSTEDGDCLSLCNLTSGGCVGVCAGICVVDKAPPPPPPPGCVTDADCTAVWNYCAAGCSCSAMPKGTAFTCAPPGAETATCILNPCFGAKAVCNANGSCSLVLPPPPPPINSDCEKRTMGGPTSCKDASTWKRYSDEDCRASGRSLTSYTPRETCAGGNTVYVDYVCCSISPPTPG
jgi:hypothetical protein